MKTLVDSAVSHSVLARLDPRWKLGGTAIAVVGVAMLESWKPAVAALVYSMFLAAVARLRLGWYTARTAPIMAFLLLFVVFLPWPLAVTLMAKGLAILTLMLTVVAATPLHELLQAAHALRVPGLLIQLALLTHRYVHLLLAELRRIRIALRVRAFRARANVHGYRTAGHVAGSLFVRSLERAERVGQAMQCRGFHGEFRTLAEHRTTAADVLFFVLCLTVSISLVLWDHMVGRLAVCS